MDNNKKKDIDQNIIKNKNKIFKKYYDDIDIKLPQL